MANAPYDDYWLADNMQANRGESMIVKSSLPRVFIKFNDELAMFADFNSFYAHAQVEWIDRTSEAEKAQILADAYDFLAIEDRILDGDTADIEFEC